MKHVLSGRYARDPSVTYQFGQYTSRGSGGNDPSGYSITEGMESPGHAVNEKSKKEETNTDVGERDAEETPGLI
jgi:hypothetical protein